MRKQYYRRFWRDFQWNKFSLFDEITSYLFFHPLRGKLIFILHDIYVGNLWRAGPHTFNDKAILQKILKRFSMIRQSYGRFLKRISSRGQNSMIQKSVFYANSVIYKLVSSLNFCTNLRMYDFFEKIWKFVRLFKSKLVCKHMNSRSQLKLIKCLIFFPLLRHLGKLATVKGEQGPGPGNGFQAIELSSAKLTHILSGSPTHFLLSSQLGNLTSTHPDTLKQAAGKMDLKKIDSEILWIKITLKLKSKLH